MKMPLNIGPSSPQADDARRLFERAQVAQFDVLWQMVESDRRSGGAGVGRLAATTLRPAAEQAVVFARAHATHR